MNNNKDGFCLFCGFLKDGQPHDEDCKLQFVTLCHPIKRTPLQKVIDYLTDDIGYTLAFFAGTVMNAFIVYHFDMTFVQNIVWSFCAGLVMCRALK